jgi:hypothetical protein
VNEERTFHLRRLAGHVFDGTEAHEIIDALMEAVLAANGDLGKTSRASLEAKNQLCVLLAGRVHIDAVTNFLGDW